MPLPDLRALRDSAQELKGQVPGVYLLFDADELVFVGQSWNCLLRVAENTGKDSDKHFTHWSYLPVESAAERKALEREFRQVHSPRYNRA